MLLYPPFLVGRSVEIALANKGVKVFGFDLFEPLTNFWQHQLTKPKTLASAVELFFPLSKEQFYQIQNKLNNYGLPKTGLLPAALFYVLNRASYSGTTLSGGNVYWTPKIY